MSVADATGNMVSVTQTVNGDFGAKVAPAGFNLVLNSEVADFSSNPESPSAITPGKTPLIAQATTWADYLN